MITADDYRIKTVRSLLRIAGPWGLLRYLLSKVTGRAVDARVYMAAAPGVPAPVSIRLPSSDVLTFWQVFVDQEYAISVRRPPRTIIDAGANIGLASIYFATRFPEARIVAIEPEKSNFEMLCRNVKPYRNIVPVCAAIWNENKRISLVDPGLGHSGFMTFDRADEGAGQPLELIDAVTIARIMDDHGLEHVDILKMDVEGAESEVFEDPFWIGRVDSLIVELHERMKPGSSSSFNRAVSGFAKRWTIGENVCVTRLDGCLLGA